MNPADASVYSDTWSAGTWAAVLSVIVLMVIALMCAFIYLVHRACEAEGPSATAATPAPTPVATPKPRAGIAARRRHRLVGHPH